MPNPNVKNNNFQENWSWFEFTLFVVLTLVATVILMQMLITLFSGK